MIDLVQDKEFLYRSILAQISEMVIKKYDGKIVYSNNYCRLLSMLPELVVAGLDLDLVSEIYCYDLCSAVINHCYDQYVYIEFLDYNLCAVSNKPQRQAQCVNQKQYEFCKQNLSVIVEDIYGRIEQQSQAEFK